MYRMSSALASQTCNKTTVWNCLVLQGLVAGDISKFDADRMIVQPWAVGIRVVIKRAYKGIEIFKGLSTIISPFKIARQIMAQTEYKSIGLGVKRIRDNVFLVDSFQDRGEKHTVMAYPDKLTCNCMKFKCLSSRLPREAVDLLEAIEQVEEHGSKIASAQGRVHIQCHHIRAVMREGFDAFTSAEYLKNYRQSIVNYRQQRQVS